MQRRLPTSLRLVAVLGAALHSSPATAQQPPPPPTKQPLDEQAELEKARNAYRAHEYDEADGRFLKLLNPQGGLTDKVLIKQARMYWAATRVALHQEEDARGQFRLILNEDPEYLPDPLAFPKEVRDLFTDTKTAMAQELEETKREAYRKIAERRANEEAAKAREALRIKLLEKQAGESFITQKHSRWVAVLPFGVGQFQNGQRAAGWTFLAVEGVLLAGGIATVPVFYVDSANARATDVAVTQSVARQWDSYAADARIVNLSLYGGLALTALIGAIQAEVAFVPEDVKTEPRPLPEVPGAAPAASPHSAARLPFSFGAAPLPGRDGRGVGGASLGAFVSF